MILHECTMGCGRMFNPETIEKHEKICYKVFQSKRKAFDSANHRQIESENYSAAPISKIKEKPKPKVEIPKWKIESARLRVGIKVNKTEEVSKEQALLMKAEESLLKPCPYCGRRFNEGASLKHVPFCQKKAKQLPRNPVPRKK